MTYQLKKYLIRCITNLHAGSGKNDYGAIDNLVQRDAATGFPCIFDSSIKGALREFFESGLPLRNQDLINYYFGEESNDENLSKRGNYLFHQAQLLSVPIRSNIDPYFLVTCPLIMKETAERLQFFNEDHTVLVNALNAIAAFFELLPDLAAYTGQYNRGCCLEEEDLLITSSITLNEKAQEIKELFGNGADFVIVKNSQFSNLVDNMHLPVIARNKLVNGISKNLWYEQLIARESRFLLFILTPEVTNNYFDAFNEAVTTRLVQVGANATVGYGQCKFELK